MPISLKWLNDENTILLWLAEGEVSQQDRDAAEVELYQFRQLVSRQIGVVRDERNATNPDSSDNIARMGGSLIPDAQSHVPMPLTAYVVQPDQVEMFNQTFRHISDQFNAMFPDADETVMKGVLNTMKATSSLEEAVTWINATLANDTEE
jgi:hypothetical protein